MCIADEDIIIEFHIFSIGRKKRFLHEGRTIRLTAPYFSRHLIASQKTSFRTLSIN